jgi:hypothetical protein
MFKKEDRDPVDDMLGERFQKHFNCYLVLVGFYGAILCQAVIRGWVHIPSFFW